MIIRPQKITREMLKKPELMFANGLFTDVLLDPAVYAKFLKLHKKKLSKNIKATTGRTAVMPSFYLGVVKG